MAWRLILNGETNVTLRDLWEYWSLDDLARATALLDQRDAMERAAASGPGKE